MILPVLSVLQKKEFDSLYVCCYCASGISSLRASMKTEKGMSVWNKRKTNKKRKAQIQKKKRRRTFVFTFSHYKGKL